MFEKIEEMFRKNPVLGYVVVGVSVCMAIAAGIVSVVLGICMFTVSAWLAIPFVLCVIASGACFGIAAYQAEEL